MRISRLVFGKYLGCAFLAIGSLYGQTNLVQNGNFTQGGDGLDHWTNSDPTRFHVSTFTSGCESGYPCYFVGNSSPPGEITLSQTITGFEQGATYDLGFYLKSDSFVSNSFVVSIGGEQLISLSNFSNPSCSKQSATYKANSASAVLSFVSNPGLDYQNLILSNVSLFFNSNPSPILVPPSYQTEASAAKSANGQTVNTKFTTVETVTVVGSQISSAAASSPANSVEADTSSTNSVDSKQEASKTASSNNSGDDSSGGGCTIMPNVSLSSISVKSSLASISSSALLVSKGMLASLNSQDPKNIDLFSANLKNLDNEAVLNNSIEKA